VRPIDPALVDEVWREMIGQPPGRVEALAQAFLAQQPHAAAFARAATQGQDAVVQKAAFGLCFLLFKILERSLGQPFPTVSARRLQEADEASAASRERAPDAVTALLHAAAPDHPTLVAHMLEVFYGDAAGPADYDESVRARLLVLLRTLSDALDVGSVEA
jgi:hypothetical protein